MYRVVHVLGLKIYGETTNMSKISEVTGLFESFYHMHMTSRLGNREFKVQFAQWQHPPNKKKYTMDPGIYSLMNTNK